MLPEEILRNHDEIQGDVWQMEENHRWGAKLTPAQRPMRSVIVQQYDKYMQLVRHYEHFYLLGHGNNRGIITK